MNAHQLCAINALPPSLIRGYLLMLASGVHERNSAPAPDIALSLPSIPQRGVFLATESASSMGGNTVSWGES